MCFLQKLALPKIIRKEGMCCGFSQVYVPLSAAQCGKERLMNLLGAGAVVSNYPGTTVELPQGIYKHPMAILL